MVTHGKVLKKHLLFPGWYFAEFIVLLLEIPTPF